MNTILITGTAKTIAVKLSNVGTGFKVSYNVNIWASQENEQLQFITSKTNMVNCGYGDLWNVAKDIASKYFSNDKLNDGAYTQYLDHLITI